MQQELSRLDEGEFQTLSRGVIEELTRRGELPEDLTSLTEEELQDRVFTQITSRLAKRAPSKSIAIY